MLKKLSLFILPLLITLACSPQNAKRGQVTGWDRVDWILDQIHEPVFPDQSWNITDFGAVADGKTDCKTAFDKAIAECNLESGGTIIVPAGTYRINGPLHLKSNVHLYLEEGSKLEFSGEPKDFLPVVLTRWEGVEVYNYSPIIYAYEATNIAITGKGTIDGNAKVEFAGWIHKQKTDQLTLRQLGNDLAPVNERIFGQGHFLRPSLIQPFGCNNVLIDGVTIKDSPFWIIHPVYCENVIVRNVTVNSWNTNNDGCDPDGSSNVLIENCTFNTGDDGVAIKAGRDQDAWRVGRPTENVVIRNCNILSKCNGLCIGSEMSASVRHVFMENCTVDTALSTVYFKGNLDRGGRIEEVYIRNVKVNRAIGACIRFEPNYQGHRGNHFPPLFRNFVIENITCGIADNYGIFAQGHPESQLQNILFKDITINKARQAYYLKMAKNIRMDNVVINGETLPKIPALSPDNLQKLDMGW